MIKIEIKLSEVDGSNRKLDELIYETRALHAEIKS
jgi:hypothetical protein